MGYIRKKLVPMTYSDHKRLQLLWMATLEDRVKRQLKERGNSFEYSTDISFHSYNIVKIKMSTLKKE